MNRHFEAKLAKYKNLHIMETTASISILMKFCVTILSGPVNFIAATFAFSSLENAFCDGSVNLSADRQGM